MPQPNLTEIITTILRRKSGSVQSKILMDLLTPMGDQREVIEPGPEMPSVRRPVNPWGVSPPVVGTELAQILEAFFRVKPALRDRVSGASRGHHEGALQLLGGSDAAHLFTSNIGGAFTAANKEMYVNPYITPTSGESLIMDLGGPVAMPRIVAHELTHAAGRGEAGADIAGELARRLIDDELSALLIPSNKGTRTAKVQPRKERKIIAPKVSPEIRALQDAYQRAATPINRAFLSDSKFPRTEDPLQVDPGGELPLVRRPGLFRTPTEVIGGTDFARAVDRLTTDVPDLKGRMKKIVHGWTPGVMEVLDRRKIPVESFPSTNLMGLHSLTEREIAVNPSQDASRSDFQTTLGHEFGHGLGIKHGPYLDALEAFLRDAYTRRRISPR